MSVLDQLASVLGRRDEVPNQELAQQIAAKNNGKAVKELVENLHHKSKDIQNDCIKVLYEIGERKPALIAGYGKEFLALLTHRNNRLQWGAMTALQTMTLEDLPFIHTSLPQIIAAADSGSVITKDQAVQILVKLCSGKKYYEDAFTLLLEQLNNSPVNQLPMYAEQALPIVNDKNKTSFIKILAARLPDIDKESKQKRVEKVIKKLTALRK